MKAEKIYESSRMPGTRSRWSEERKPVGVLEKLRLHTTAQRLSLCKNTATVRLKHQPDASFWLERRVSVTDKWRDVTAASTASQPRTNTRLDRDGWVNASSMSDKTTDIPTGTHIILTLNGLSLEILECSHTILVLGISWTRYEQKHVHVHVCMAWRNDVITRLNRVERQQTSAAAFHFTYFESRN